MSNQLQPLGGKVALVTGGSRGIGAAIVKRLARDGAHVTFTYSSSPERAQAVVSEVAAFGGRATAVHADSADEAEVRSSIERAADASGRLDVLVNSAGILMLGHMDAYPLEDFDKMFRVNVRAAFVAAQAAAKRMAEGGRIIVIGSVVAQRAGFPGTSVYSMTKAAVAGMVRGMAVDLAPRGITVNIIQPGPTATDMNPEDSPHREAVLRLLPVGRMGHDHEVAAMVSYLAGPEAGFVTGSSLTIDGGYLA